MDGANVEFTGTFFRTPAMPMGTLTAYSCCRTGSPAPPGPKWGLRRTLLPRGTLAKNSKRKEMKPKKQLRNCQQEGMSKTSHQPYHLIFFHLSFLVQMTFVSLWVSPQSTLASELTPTWFQPIKCHPLSITFKRAPVDHLPVCDDGSHRVGQKPPKQ